MKKIVLMLLLVTVLFGEFIRNEKLGIVEDTQSHLIWKTYPSVLFSSLDDAKKYCQNLKIQNLFWRLPNRSEYEQLLRKYTLPRPYYWWSDRIGSQNYTVCVTDDKIKKDVSNSIKIKNSIPKKPKVENYTQREYETEEEFTTSKNNSIKRWEHIIDNYEKSSKIIIKIIDYDISVDRVKYSYDIPLKGIGKQSREKIINYKDAKKSAIKTGADINATVILGQNREERFYIKEIIFDTKDIDIKKHSKIVLDKDSVINIILLEKLPIEIDGADDEIASGTEITYNRYEKKIISPEEYKDALFVKEPHYKKEIKLCSFSVKELNKNKQKSHLNVKSNFEIKDIYFKEKGNKKYIQLKFIEDSYNPNSLQGVYQTKPKVIKKDTEKYVVKIIGKKSYEEFFECDRVSQKCVSLESKRFL